jgi:hypothetical protein
MTCPAPTCTTAPAAINTVTTHNNGAFQLNNSHFGSGITLDGPILATECSRLAYASFWMNNPNLSVPRTPPPAGPRAMITPGPIISPCNQDRDSCARELCANQSDITTLANAPYHCGINEGINPLTSSVLATIGYNNIGLEDVIACHNNIIDTHCRTLQWWHNPTANTFGPQVNCILQKSHKLFPVLESTLTADAVEFYNQLQETALDHLLALMLFDAIMLRFGFKGLYVPGLGINRYSRMGKALMDLLPCLIPGSLSPQINAALYSVRYKSNNRYDYLWCALELTVPGV